MKKIRLTELENQSSIEKLTNNDLTNLVGAGCGTCCGSTGRDLPTM